MQNDSEIQAETPVESKKRTYTTHESEILEMAVMRLRNSLSQERKRTKYLEKLCKDQQRLIVSHYNLQQSYERNQDRMAAAVRHLVEQNNQCAAEIDRCEQIIKSCNTVLEATEVISDPLQQQSLYLCPSELEALVRGL